MFADLLAAAEAMSADEMTAELRSLELARRAIEARIAAVVSAAERTGNYLADGHGSITAWVRANTNQPTGDTGARVRSARVCHAHSVVGDALAAGAIGTGQVGELGRAHANPRCGHLLGDAIGVLLGHAVDLRFDDFRLCVRRWTLLADPDGSFREHEAAHAERHASVTQVGDDVQVLAQGTGVAGAELVEIFERFCHAEYLDDLEAARQMAAGPGAPCSPNTIRTDPQRRFDALLTIFRTAAGAPTKVAVPDVVVNIVVDQHTFQAHLDAAVTGQPAERPTDLARLARDGRCETAGGHLVHPTDVIAAAVAGHVRRVVFDSSGTVIDLGRRSRLFAGAARDALRLQDRHCLWPGCNAPPWRTQADHTTPWSHGGPTTMSNGGPVCPRHNRHKNHGHTTRRVAPGVWAVYRPDGTPISPALATLPVDPAA